MPADETVSKLREDVFVFSACKTHIQLKEVSTRLLDENGKIQSWQNFSRQVMATHKEYNENYLQAEYIFATSSAEMAGRWSQFDQEGTRYNLQYRTAQDNRVRESHRAMAGITLPADDPFWDSYFPPNGWRCRCTTVQVSKGKYPESDSGDSIKKAEVATTQIDSKGRNRGEMFRFNPGKQQVIFPPNHPYYKVKAAIPKTLEKEVPKEYTDEDIKVLMESSGYERCLKRVETDKKFKPYANVKKEELAAINHYTEGGYFKLNSGLAKKDNTPSVTSLEKVLNAALDKLPKDKDQAYFRGKSLRPEVVQLYKKHFEDQTPKEEHNFTSATKKKTIAEDFGASNLGEHSTLFRIHGKNARDVQPLSEHWKEAEVLFKSKTRFMVRDFKEIKVKDELRYEVELEEIE